MGKPSAPEAPDISGLVAATEKQADLSYQIAQDQLAWAKEQYATDQITVNKVVDSMLKTEDFTQANAEADRARYEETFQPLEDQFVQQVQEYASPERTAFEVGRAQADVSQQFDQAREASQQQLESFGLNPNDTRYQALDVGTRTQQAAASAAAGTQAATNVENTQLGLLGEAINIGKGYPSQVAQSYATSLGAGSGAAGATNAATQTASGAMTAPVGYISAGNQGYDVSGSTQANIYSSEMSGYNAALASTSGWGSALGSLAGLAGLGLMKMDEGGEVPTRRSPSEGAIPDDIPAKLTAGEFVIPDDVVRWKGAEYFYKEINKAREKKGEALSAIPANGSRPPMPSNAGVRGYQQGGVVGGPVDPSQYETKLSQDEEAHFQAWKQQYAPGDSGYDYDLRGAFKAGLTPDPQTGHWPDTFKKPNHPTFSDQSIYAKDRPDLAGHWNGDTYMPPGARQGPVNPQLQPRAAPASAIPAAQ